VDTGDAAKRAVRVTIFRQNYAIRTAGDPTDTETLAAGVDELMNRIADRANTDDPSRVAVLAALHLADKVRALERLSKELEERASTLADRVRKAEQRNDELARRTSEIERDAAAPEARLKDTYRRLQVLEERLACMLEDNEHRK